MLVQAELHVELLRRAAALRCTALRCRPNLAWAQSKSIFKFTPASSLCAWLLRSQTEVAHLLPATPKFGHRKGDKKKRGALQSHFSYVAHPRPPRQRISGHWPLAHFFFFFFRETRHRDVRRSTFDACMHTSEVWPRRWARQVTFSCISSRRLFHARRPLSLPFASERCRIARLS